MSNGNDKSLESWIWDAACSIRGAKAFTLVKHDKKLVCFYLPLEPEDPEKSIWSVIRIPPKTQEGSKGGVECTGGGGKRHRCRT